MSIDEFIKDKIVIILCNMMMFIILTAIMLIVNVNFIIIVFVFCIWFLPLVSYMALDFIKYKKYYDEINGILERLDQR
jgi:ABC-type bacteriocin/lantibiotic exporter with double-glycine peptidase domain